MKVGIEVGSCRERMDSRAIKEAEPTGLGS